MRRTRASRHGFTLLEALVSLIIFTILMFALSLALAGAMRARASLEVHQGGGATARAIFGLLERDLAAASVSKSSASSLFMGGTAASSGGSNSLLMLSALTHKVHAGSPDTGILKAGASGQAGPEWDGALVRYDLDRQKGELHRIVLAVPNVQTLMKESAPGDATLIADHLSALTLRFYDGGQQTWRSDWNYIGSPVSSSSGSTASGGSGSQNDTSLPRAVEVTLVLRRSDGSPVTYSTRLPVTASAPLDFAPTATSSGTSGTGAGSAGTGGTGTGGASGGTTTGTGGQGGSASGGG